MTLIPGSEPGFQPVGQDNHAKIELSVIIPTYNRAKLLRACLEALAYQTQPVTDFEVIVVVDGSSDGTEQMLANLTTPYMLRVIHLTNSGPGAARNRGVEAALGCYCLFLDDDIIADPRLVAEHLRVQAECKGVVGLGAIPRRLPRRAGGFAHFLAQWSEGHYARLKEGMRSPCFTDCYSGNLSVPRAAFLRVGGFATDLPRSEDIELGYRLTEQRLPFVYIPDAIGHQQYLKNFREIAVDSEKAGIAGVKLYERHPRTLPQMELGRFCEASLRAALTRRVLLTLRIPICLLALVDPLLGRRSWTLAWYRALYSYFYWRGVRRAVPNCDIWQRLTHGN